MTYVICYKGNYKKDEKQLINLINTVINGLENPNYFIPYEEWELEQIFDKTYAPIVGAYVGEKLVGMAQLYVREDFVEDISKVLGINKYKVCELGGCLVLPEYRGNNIMYQLLKVLVELARTMNFNYCIAMAHPENIASVKSIEKLGLTRKITTNNEYIRDVFVMKL